MTNRSQVSLSNLVVTDEQAPPASQGNLSPILCQTRTLAPQDSTTCTAQYTVTQADLDNGSLRDTVTATGLDPGGATVTAPPATLTITSARPGIHVVKSTTATVANAVGQQIPYTFLVTNTGNVTLFGVAVADTVTPPSTQANASAVTCPNPALAPGESQSCTGRYTVTLADLANGTLADSATATGTPEGGTAVTSDPSDLSIPTQLPGSLTIVKSTPTAAVTAIGQVIPYTFLVTNNSSVAVTSVAVTDTVEAPSLPENLTTPICGSTTLTPGASTTCTATYRVTSADVNQGVVADSARATGRDPSNNPVVSSPSRVELRSPISALTIVKSTTATSVSAVGQQVPYSFLVTNTGNQTLTNVAVADTQVPPGSQGNMSAVTCPLTTLTTGASTTCTGTYTVTADDLANGSVNDFATASGQNPGGTTVTSPQSSTTVNATPAALTMVKASSTNSFSEIGQPVRYTFTVRNNSSTTYRNISIQDTQVAPATQGRLSGIVCDTTTLAPSEVAVCSATYSVTAADITNGWLSDFATATGLDVAGNTYTTARSSTIIPAVQRPAITVTKTSPTTRITAVGQEVTYTFTVRNTGNVTLTGVGVTDVVAPPSDPAGLSPVACPTSPVPPAGTITCTAMYTVTQVDVDHGSVADSATASGTPPATPADPNPPVIGSPVSTLRIDTDPSPALTVVKSSPQSMTPPTAAGEQISYDFRVRNTGNLTLSDIRVDDIQVAPASQANLSAVACPPQDLAPGDELVCTATYTVTQADVDSGTVTDRATASGQPPATPADPNPPRTTSPESTLTIPSPPRPSLTVAKSSTTTTVTRAGQEVVYSFVVTNTGNVQLRGIGVDDQVAAPSSPAALSPVTCPQDVLAPAESVTCSATYTVTQADVDNGSLTDTATAHGIPPATTADPNPAPAVSPPSAVTIAATTSASLTIDKSTDTLAATTVGQRVQYSFLVTNTGNVVLTGVTVTDTVAQPSDPANLSPVVCPTGTLAPGEHMTCVATYTVTAADLLLGGALSDTATAGGVRPDGTTIGSGESTLALPVRPLQSLPIVTG